MNHDDPIGSVADEAMKLVHALTTPRSEDITVADGHEHAETCQWCPVCRVVNVVRDNPEAVENVVASASAFAHSVKLLLDGAIQSERTEDDKT